jgi:hypothetical protein
VAHYFAQRMLAAAAMTVLVASCGTADRSSTSNQPFTPDIQGISDAIATEAHYPTNAIELTSSQVRLRISVRDPKLATADEMTRNAAAAALVAVTEQVLAAHPEYAKLEAISVAIIHPNAEGSATSDWHVEDVVEFRKGQNQRFSLHTT